MKVYTMRIRPGEFWVADIRFTNAIGSKKPPVLVLRLDGADAVAAAVTTAGPRSATDVVLTGWKASGLIRPSTVRLSRLDCLEHSLLIWRIGEITAADGERVKTTWSTYIKLQF
jgi:mRNA interferase MazF